MQKQKIELSSFEATAYWWVTLIKSKVREIVVRGNGNKSEIRFATLFYNYTEVEWRKLYLELINFITEDVNNYVPVKNIFGIDAFHQDTAKGGHDDMNRALSKILHKKVPDIRLASDDLKDFVIYTNMFGASVWYKSCGVTDLPTKYEPSYLLTGDEEERNFYNLFLATIVVLNKTDSEFQSTIFLKDIFCKEFLLRNAQTKQLEEIIEMFKYAFEKANDCGLLFGSAYQETYFCSFRDIDLVGLEPYMELASQFAKAILCEAKEKKSCKKFKKTN